MSRTFADSLDADLDTVFLNDDEFGEEVTVARATGDSSTTVTGVVSPEEGVQHESEPGVVAFYTRRVVTRFAGEFTPAIGDTATVNAVSYAVVGVARQFGSAWQLTLHRTAASEVTRQNYRRTR